MWLAKHEAGAVLLAALLCWTSPSLAAGTQLQEVWQFKNTCPSDINSTSIKAIIAAANKITNTTWGNPQWNEFYTHLCDNLTAGVCSSRRRVLMQQTVLAANSSCVGQRIFVYLEASPANPEELHQYVKSKYFEVYWAQALKDNATLPNPDIKWKSGQTGNSTAPTNITMPSVPPSFSPSPAKSSGSAPPPPPAKSITTVASPSPVKVDSVAPSPPPPPGRNNVAPSSPGKVIGSSAPEPSPSPPASSNKPPPPPPSKPGLSGSPPPADYISPPPAAYDYPPPSPISSSPGGAKGSAPPPPPTKPAGSGASPPSPPYTSPPPAAASTARPSPPPASGPSGTPGAGSGGSPPLAAAKPPMAPSNSAVSPPPPPPPPAAKPPATPSPSAARPPPPPPATKGPLPASNATAVPPPGAGNATSSGGSSSSSGLSNGAIIGIVVGSTVALALALGAAAMCFAQNQRVAREKLNTELAAFRFRRATKEGSLSFKSSSNFDRWEALRETHAATSADLDQRTLSMRSRGQAPGSTNSWVDRAQEPAPSRGSAYAREPAPAASSSALKPKPAPSSTREPGPGAGSSSFARASAPEAEHEINLEDERVLAPSHSRSSLPESSSYEEKKSSNFFGRFSRKN